LYAKGGYVTDEELLTSFESRTLPGEAFTHEAHVRVAWCYLQRLPFSEALARFSAALRSFAAGQNASGKYNETITVAYMAVIAARLDETPSARWEDFRSSHPDLFARPSVLSRHYSDALLQSAAAKRAFVLPDRLPAQPGPR
jgi:hypothetical protein